MPNLDFSLDYIPDYSHLNVTDPADSISSAIDMLLGADIFSLALRGNVFSVSNDMPLAIDTLFGLGSHRQC